MIDQEKEFTSFAFILYSCAMAFKNELNKELYKVTSEEINIDYWFILSVLYETDNISHGLLAERVCRDKASLSRTLDLMEKQGLLRRNTDPNDKRGSFIVLTKKSIELRNTALIAATDFTKNKLTGLSPIEIKELVRMINRVFNNLQGE